LIRDVDRIKGELIESNGLTEFEFGCGIVQVIDATVLYEVLVRLARKGETIYGKWMF